jgi:hypothetical protein
MIISGQVLTIDGPKDLKDITKLDWVLSGNIPTRITDIQKTTVKMYKTFSTVPNLWVGKDTEMKTLQGMVNMKTKDEADLTRPYTSIIHAEASIKKSSKDLIGYIFQLANGSHTIVVENCEVECDA